MHTSQLSVVDRMMSDACLHAEPYILQNLSSSAASGAFSSDAPDLRLLEYW